MNLKAPQNSSPGGLAGPARVAFMALLAVMLAGGCHKPVPTEVVDVQEGITPTDPQVAANLADLSGLLRRSMHQHRMTGTFENFVEVTKANVPPPPTGEKYAISKRWKVILVEANAK